MCVLPSWGQRLALAPPVMRSKTLSALPQVRLSAEGWYRQKTWPDGSLNRAVPPMLLKAAEVWKVSPRRLSACSAATTTSLRASGHDHLQQTTSKQVSLSRSAGGSRRPFGGRRNWDRLVVGGSEQRELTTHAEAHCCNFLWRNTLVRQQILRGSA